MCIRRACAILAPTFVLCVTTVSLAQSPEPSGTSAGPFSAEPRFFAPFSANAVTTIVQRTPGGGRLSRKLTAAFYRDSLGRVRVEYTPRSDAGNDERKVAMVQPNPYARRDRVFLVDDAAKMVELMDDFNIASGLFSGRSHISIPTGVRRFTDFFTSVSRSSGDGIFDDLGSQTINGVTANGVRFTTTLSKAVDERWDSPDLGILVRARFVDDSALGWDIEYEVTNIRRAEPPQELFALPAGYQLKAGMTIELDSPGAELYRLQKR